MVEPPLMWEGKICIYDIPRVFNNFPLFTLFSFHPSLSLSINCPPHLFLLFPPYRRTQMSQITFLFPLNFWEASLSTTFSKFSPYWMLKLHKFGIISEFRGKKNRKKCQIISPSIASHFLSLNFTLEHPFSLSKSSTLKIWKSKLNLISWPKKRFFFFLQWIGLFEASSDRTHKVEGIRASQVKNSSRSPSSCAHAWPIFSCSTLKPNKSSHL